MAKGKFKQQMHEKGISLQNSRNTLGTKPTSNGYAVADSYNHNSNYIDSFIDDLFEESSNLQKTGRRGIFINDNCSICRIVHPKDGVEIIFYLNNSEMIEYSDRYNFILREKTLYFVPDRNGLKVEVSGNYPKLRTKRLGNTLKPLVVNDKEYSIHKIVSRDNRKVWFIDLV